MSILLSLLVIAINVFFVVDLVMSKLTSSLESYLMLSGLGLYSVIYLVMIVYLMLHMFMSLGRLKDFANSSVSIIYVIWFVCINGV